MKKPSEKKLYLGKIKVSALSKTQSDAVQLTTTWNCSLKIICHGPSRDIICID
ncbi:hypothetical protein CLV51_102854 [Chitinophaga niastensis]|uniref:Uncharacterized protein n=1 Tax=Chitinophaga niastensis TaxID=536980 RepID=A0A2P8HP49_CHINA|nr:hypothetical protein CLV51_102854 [Chitinophaga niastensis]